ncbi:FxsA family protein [Tranquillimonas alkanivorans]|jgi:UPF0716 protein FxsA|uniref:UPF0716 protein FxsA n=1 Tax=Tranquillimonas alkanivorans TaxID=441119 RepID=A0A1I5LJA5_9RHOB|nr:FxsA family protein [Tranquillimonas alkanivorans]SFO96831.1 UPF0716 protein FxsA [Tranquillimonas alkanivorans]
MWLFALFVAIPLIEIALFIQVGGLIGLWPTLLIVVLTAIAGTYLVRTQGALAMSQLRSSFNRMSDPTEPLAHGAMILIAGALLLTPGFFTDAIGFALLFPPFRRVAFRWLRARVRVSSFSYGAGADPRASGRNTRPSGPQTIDGEYEDLDHPQRPTHRPSGAPSGWTRH